MPPDHDPLSVFIFDHYLHTDLLSVEQKSALVAEACATFSRSQSAVYRRIAKVADGQLCRKVRADKGAVRAISEEALSFLRVLVENRGVMTGALIYRDLKATFPDQTFCDDTVRAAIKAIEQELKGQAVRFVQPIEFRHPLDRLEVDFSVADCFMSDPAVNDGRPFRPILACLIDGCTRCVMWAEYSESDDSATFGRLLYNAIRAKADPTKWPMHGMPLQVFADWGKVFTGKFAAEMLGRLGIDGLFGHPYTPQDKGRVERWFQTCHRQLEDRLAGWCGKDNTGDDSVDPPKTFHQTKTGGWIDPRQLGQSKDRPLLTLAEANAALQAWIVGEYHQNPHSAIGCSPQEAWLRGIADETVQRRLDYSQALLEEVCLTMSATRTVQRGTVRLKGLTYIDGALAGYEGCKVNVRYAPGDCRTVRVFDLDGRSICEAEVRGIQFIDTADPSFKKQQAVYRAEAKRKRAIKDTTETVLPHEAESIIEKLQQKVDAATPVVAPKGDDTLGPLAGVPADVRAAIPEELRDKPWPQEAIADFAKCKPEDVPDLIKGFRQVQYASIYGRRWFSQYDAVFGPIEDGEDYAAEVQERRASANVPDDALDIDFDPVLAAQAARRSDADAAEATDLLAAGGDS